MNLLAILAGVLPWAATPVSAFTRIYLACSLVSLEVQIITWLGRGTLDSLLPFNAALGLAAAIWQVRSQQPRWAWVQPTRRALPMPAVLTLAAVVLALNVVRPLEAADPYQLDRVLQIERSGSLVYSAALDPKANIATAFYELVLADVGGIPLAGSWLVRVHGLLGLFLISLAMASVQTWLPFPSSIWARTLFFVTPVAFHQLVLIKNDLFIGAPAFVALAWAVGASRRVTPGQVLWAGWLAGLVAAAKLTNMALALAIAGGVYVRDRSGTLLLRLGTGVAAGVLAGGLFLTLWQNARVYGDPLALREVEAMGSVNRSPGEAVVGLARFGLSLFDMSLLTRQLWPGRGGWGGAFGLPLMWALAVLLTAWRSSADARRALLIGGTGLFALGLTFADADVSHRLALGPGLVLIAAGIAVSRGLPQRWVRPALVAAVVLSSLQIARSAVLYLMQR